MATSIFNVPLVVEAPTQVEADNKRDAALLDYCKAYNLPIYDVDGITPLPALVASEFRKHIRAHVKGVVVEFRSQAVGTTAANTERQTQEAGLVIT